MNGEPELKQRGRPDIAVLVLSAVAALVLVACGPIVGWHSVVGLGAIYVLAGALAFVRPIAFPLEEPDPVARTPDL